LYFAVSYYGTLALLLFVFDIIHLLYIWEPKLAPCHKIHVCEEVATVAVCFALLCTGLTSTRLVREPGHHRPLFTVNSKVPGFAAVAMRRENLPPSGRGASPTKRNSDAQGKQVLS